MSWRDRVIGILLGLVIGIVAVVLFVIYGSSGLDAPSLEDGAGERGPGQERPLNPPRPQGGE